jgi:O-antigen ligase
MKIRCGGESFTGGQRQKMFCVIIRLAQLLPFLAALSTVFVVRHDMANGVASGKYWWFYCAMAAVAAAGTVCGFLGSKSLRLRMVDFFVLLFCLWSLAVTWVNGGAGSVKFILLALLLLLYFYFRYYLSQRHGGRGGSYLLLFFLLTGLVESVWGLGQLYGFWASQHGRFKLTGSFFNPGPYAGYLAVVAPVAFYYLLSDYRALRRKLCWRYYPFYLRWGLSAMAALAMLLALPATMSRAAWVAAAGGCGLVMAAKNYELRIRRKKSTGSKNCKLPEEVKPIARAKVRRTALLLAAVIILAACAVGAYYLKKDSADGRLLIWKIAAQAALKHPLGVGLGHFAGAYGEEQAAYFASGQGSEQEQQVAGSPEYGFNEYLQMSVELGLVPLLAFVGVIALAFRSGIRRRRYAPLGALCSLLLFGSMSYPFSVLPFTVALVLLIALCISEEEDVGRQRPKQKILHRSLRIALLIATFACLSSRRASCEAYRGWQEAQMLHNAAMHQAAAEEYAKLYGELSYEIRFLFEYAQSLSKSGQHEESNRVLEQAMKISCDPMLYNVSGRNFQAQKAYAAAEKRFWQAAHIAPSRLYPYYLLAKLYAEMELREKACAMAKIVLTKEPKVDSRAVQEMREEMKQLAACQSNL